MLFAPSEYQQFRERIILLLKIKETLDLITMNWPGISSDIFFSFGWLIVKVILDVLNSLDFIFAAEI